MKGARSDGDCGDCTLERGAGEGAGSMSRVAHQFLVSIRAKMRHLGRADIRAFSDIASSAAPDASRAAGAGAGTEDAANVQPYQRAAVPTCSRTKGGRHT